MAPLIYSLSYTLPTALGVHFVFPILTVSFSFFFFAFCALIFFFYVGTFTE